MTTYGPRLLIVIALGAMCLCFPPAARAGDGVVAGGTPNRLTLSVASSFDTSADFRPSGVWEGAFTRASELLYNSTEGQVQIDEVSFYNNCPEVHERADIIIHPGSDRASAHVGGLGTSGRHIFLYDQLHRRNEAAARGHFGVVHELGHYAFGLFDEYRDSAGNDTSCIDDTSTIASIMDGGTAVSLENQRTEWSVAAYEKQCKDTEQFQKRGMTAWPWIAKYVRDHYGVTLQIPSTYNTITPSGHQALTFKYYDCKIRAVVCMDRSGSMQGDKLRTAQAGGALFTTLAKGSEELGIVSYATTPTANYGIGPMTVTNKAAALLAVAGLSASGSTNIGGGLQTSLDMIASRGQPVSSETVVLLSDGLHNVGTAPNSVLPALKARKVKVYTIGLGSDADPNLLTLIAQETGGSYYFASNAFALLPHFLSIYATMRNDGMITQINDKLGASNERQHAILMDSYTTTAGEATFVLSWDAGNLDLRLIRPDGSAVNPNDPDVDTHVREGMSDLYRIKSPVTGVWTARVQSGAADANYSLQVNSTARSGVAAIATTDKPGYVPGENIHLEMSVMAPPASGASGLPVAGAQVTASIRLDGNPFGTLTLYDDGSDTHGDLQRDDGVYSAYVVPSQGGNYQFDVLANNQTGRISRLGEKGPVPAAEPVSPFTRQAQVTVFVKQGPPVTPTPDATIQPALSPTPIVLSSPDNGSGLGLFIGLAGLVGAVIVITAAARRRRPSAGSGQGARARLTGLASQGAFTVADGAVMGRDPGCTLRLADPYVSRRHARLRYAQGVWYIQDLGSKGGTFVNGNAVTATALRDGDRIRVGGAEFVFQGGG